MILEVFSNIRNSIILLHYCVSIILLLYCVFVSDM